MVKKSILFTVVFLFAFSSFLYSAPGDGGFCSITIMYDNYAFQQGTAADWGFSCLVRGMEKTILFDAGARSDILFRNMKELNVQAGEIELFVPSHMHNDHLGGLSDLLDKNGRIIAYIPAAWPAYIEWAVIRNRAKIVKISGPTEIAEGVYVTGGMGVGTVEQAMVLDTPAGLVVITGCSHPGIVSIVAKTKEILDKEIYLVLGGFHLADFSDKQVMEIIDGLKKLGVKKCAATHCTGDRAIRLFKEAFGGDYITAGTGCVLAIPQ
jgi:7,8-dihydropterin-6-yl-methyl-4-(beta-D-ribofuranosyl)aminobenzene 5'-phosphate synthase